MSINSSSQNNFFRQALFLLSLITIGLVIFFKLNFFTGCFLGAITLYVLLRRPFFYLTEHRGWGAARAALLIVFVSAILLAGAGFGAFNLLYAKIASANTAALFDGIKVVGDKVHEITGYNIIPKDIIVQSKDILMDIVSNLLNTTYSVFANMLMMFVVLYFMLAAGRSMEHHVLSYSPFRSTSLEKIKTEVKNMIMSNAVGIPVIILAQSIVASLGYWILGVNDAVFWGFITGLFGIVPLLGTTIIWLPLSIYLLVSGAEWQGVVLAIYGLLIIGNTDNVVRFVLLKKMANVHPLIAIFGVILGIPLFGFWGIIFGPLLISGFLLLIKIYYSEYKQPKLMGDE